MLWLEMSRDQLHGGDGWEFTRTLWSPARKRDGSKWAFWENVFKVREGDLIVHLRDIGRESFFVGTSTADTDGFETNQRPPKLSQWSFATAIYRVDLRNYVSFPFPISMAQVFLQQSDLLRAYFKENKAAKARRHIFYVIQSNQLRRLNGAYLSEVDNRLAYLLLGSNFGSAIAKPDELVHDINTAERICELAVRVGQGDFSRNVRLNYQSHCCFPGCSVAEDEFLVASHIARWADVPERRGDISNGLCFCLMHDQAFERGFFTLDQNYRVRVNYTNLRAANSDWSKEHLVPYEGQSINMGDIVPSEDALLEHWIRIDFSP